VFEWHPVYLSVVVATAALLLVFVAGTLVARFMTRRSFPARISLRLVVVAPRAAAGRNGICALVLVGNNGPVGRVLNDTFARSCVHARMRRFWLRRLWRFP
jgi:ABC-type molybdate transport system permease subunit